MPESFDRRSLLTLGCVWLVSLFLFFLTHCISPLLPDLIVDFKLSHATGGFLYALPILMIALFSYPLGRFSDRIGMEAAVGWGATIAIISSLLRPFSPTFGLLVVSTASFGLGFAFCLPNFPKLVKERFSPQRAGTATGTYTTAFPLGGGLGIVLTRPLLSATGNWRSVLLVWSLSAVPVMLLWWAVGWRDMKGRARLYGGRVPEPFAAGAVRSLKPPGEGRGGLRSGPASCRPCTQTMGEASPGRHPGPLLVAGSLLALLNVIFYCVIGWLPTYLTESGWPPATAATATSVVSFAELPAILLIPLLSDRTGQRRLIAILSFLLIALFSVVVSVRPSLSWYAIPGLGVSMGGVFSLLLALPVELGQRERVGRAAGTIISIGYGGALIGPPAAGYVRDLTGSFAAAFLATAFLGVLAAALSCGIPRPGTKHR